MSMQSRVPLGSGKFHVVVLVPKSLASHNSMQKKDDKVGNNTGYKKERQREKRKIECA